MGVWQHRLLAPLGAGHLPAVNGRASSSMDAALAKSALESLPECAAGLVGGSKPKLFCVSTLVASRDSERGRGSTLDDAPHRVFQQTILILHRSLGSEQKCIRSVALGEFLAQSSSSPSRRPMMCCSSGRQRGKRPLEPIRPARRRAQQTLGKRIVAVDPGEEPCADPASHGATEHRVDHRVEDNVVNRGNSGEEPSVSEDYVVKLLWRIGFHDDLSRPAQCSLALQPASLADLLFRDLFW